MRCTSTSEHESKAEAERSQHRRGTDRNRSPEMASAISLSDQIGLDGCTQLVAV